MGRDFKLTPTVNGSAVAVSNLPNTFSRRISIQGSTDEITFSITGHTNQTNHLFRATNGTNDVVIDSQGNLLVAGTISEGAVSLVNKYLPRDSMFASLLKWGND